MGLGLDSTGLVSLGMLSRGKRGKPSPSLAHARLLMTARRLSATGETKLAAGKIGCEQDGHMKPAGAVLEGY